MKTQEFEELVARGFHVLRVHQHTPPVFEVAPIYSHPDSFRAVLRAFERTPYYPVYRKTRDGRYVVSFIPKHERVASAGGLHLLLLVLTLASVTLAGYLWWAEGNLKLSLVFAGALLTILGGHELGHYAVARMSRMNASPPMFIPVPPNIFPFGTMGAVITMRSPVPDRDSLVALGIAGPLAGFLLALPVAAYGLSHSTALESTEVGGIAFAMPLAMQIMAGYLLPEQGAGIAPHPLAMAGWIGLFVTSINLIPLGQLDGGHIVRALTPRRYRAVYTGVLAVLVASAVLWPGWLMWAVVAYILTRLRHPGPLDDVSPLSRGAKLLIAVAALVMVLSFMPVPFIIAGEVHAP